MQDDARADRPFGQVIGQADAVASLRAAIESPVHAYVFLGPRGSGKRRAAVEFAAQLLAREDGSQRTLDLARRGEHPDVVVFEPEGKQFRTEEASDIVAAASRSPVESTHKLIVIDRFHTATPEAAAKLLKPIEEPAGGTKFILLTERIEPEHVTIASRSTRIEFGPVDEASIVDALLDVGIARPDAEAAASAAAGDVERAQLLAQDESFAERRQFWSAVPGNLDGSGYSVVSAVKTATAMVKDSQALIDEKHREELDALEEREQFMGVRGSGRTTLESRHKREVRLHRTDEWVFGLATLAKTYQSDALEAAIAAGVFERLRRAVDELTRNPNEDLWLAGVLADMPRV